ncbi:LysE family translocator [Legionella anisa]|nr:LysE family translocator [Legionella anisa]KTC77488.1 LysE type translocator [Legionella anisa]MBN5935899.1 LysE family translocator [Legionella anisa]MCW8425187.1 LysE family translocator [Legionella anisa]MCW8449391.1 LysE family translocator [Legionella anisa]UAK79847.1 LysE family translocator [Legionella anisa]
MTYLLMTSILLNIMPGPAMFYVAQQTLSRNSRAIVLSIIGIEFGTLLHIVASTAGLTCVLAQWGSFPIISKYVSACFLIYLGVSQLIKPKEISFSSPSKSIFLKGTLINALNPKIILFFMTILPQFMSSNRSYTTIHIIWMGLLFGFFGGVVNIIFSFVINALLNTTQDTAKVFIIIKGLTQLISCFFILLGIIFIWMR